MMLKNVPLVLAVVAGLLCIVALVFPRGMVLLPVALLILTLAVAILAS